MAKTNLNIINPDNPISASGYFDVPMVDSVGNYIYNDNNQINAKRFVIHGESVVDSLYDGTDSDSTVLAATANSVKTVNDSLTTISETFNNSLATLSETVNTFLTGNGKDGVVDSLSDLVNAISTNKNTIDGILNDYILKTNISNSLDSDSVDTIASSKALKDVYDFANTKYQEVSDLTNTKYQEVYDLANAKYTSELVSTTNDGLMTSSDKLKLDNLENYTLPQATETVLGGVLLSNAVNGTSTTVAATENAVNIASTTVTTNANATTKAYIVGSSTDSTTVRDTLTKDPNVYLSQTAGQLHANTFECNQQFGGTVALSDSTIDTSLGTCFTKTITANTTFTFTGASNCTCFSIILTNGGNYTITWPSIVKWAGGEAPELTTSGIDVLVFMTPNSGTNWYGFKSAIGAA